MQTCTFFFLHGFEYGDGVKAIIGIHNRATVGQDGKVAQYHAKAVVERDRDTQTVIGSEVHGFTDEITVVQNIAVGKRRAFGRACGTTGKLDIDGVIGVELFGTFRDCRIIGIAFGNPCGEFLHVAKILSGLWAINPNDPFEIG